MQTPPTTPIDNRGTLVMTWSRIPGTPTHSNTTGRFGFAPSVSAVRITWCHGNGSRVSFSIVEIPSSPSSGTGLQVAAVPGRLVGGVLGGVHDEASAARSGEGTPAR